MSTQKWRGEDVIHTTMGGFNLDGNFVYGSLVLTPSAMVYHDSSVEDVCPLVNAAKVELVNDGPIFVIAMKDGSEKKYRTGDAKAWVDVLAERLYRDAQPTTGGSDLIEAPAGGSEGPPAEPAIPPVEPVGEISGQPLEIYREEMSPGLETPASQAEGQPLPHGEVDAVPDAGPTEGTGTAEPQDASLEPVTASTETSPAAQPGLALRMAEPVPPAWPAQPAAPVQVARPTNPPPASTTQMPLHPLNSRSSPNPPPVEVILAGLEPRSPAGNEFRLSIYEWSQVWAVVSAMIVMAPANESISKDVAIQVLLPSTGFQVAGLDHRVAAQIIETALAQQQQKTVDIVAVTYGKIDFGLIYDALKGIPSPPFDPVRFATNCAAYLEFARGNLGFTVTIAKPAEVASPASKPALAPVASPRAPPGQPRRDCQFCTKCGKQNSIDARFCLRCGKPMAVLR